MIPRAGVIGWPVAHSKSPLIHGFWLERLEMAGAYVRYPVPPSDLGEFMRALPNMGPGMGLRGVNVTVPHKVAVMDYLDVVDDVARDLGAVNTVTVLEDGRLAGANTDVAGIVAGVEGAGVKGREVVILGSGGAARAAVGAAVQLGASWVTLVARDQAKGLDLLAAAGQPGSVVPFGTAMPAFPDAALLFNATSLGMVGQPALVFDLACLPAGATVFDAVYAPLETGLLAAARARGLRVVDGLVMLIGQAALAFEMFYGVAPPREYDGELRLLLEAGPTV